MNRAHEFLTTAITGSFFCTVDGVTLGTSFDRGQLVGHHGLTSAGGADHLLTRFDARNTFVHDLSVDRYTLGSVWADGRGVDLYMDHHGRGNYGTLWTRLRGRARSRAGVPTPAHAALRRAHRTGTSPQRATSRCRRVISVRS